MERLFEQFCNYPMKHFGVRELGRITGMNTKTVMKYLRMLVRQRLICRVKESRKFPYYEANRLSRTYKLIKSSIIMKNIALSGLVEFLENEIKPKAIVVFGSIQKGTYLKHSDIDLFIQAEERKVSLGAFEDYLERDVQLLFEQDLQALSTGLRNNIISGNCISGALQL